MTSRLSGHRISHDGLLHPERVWTTLFQYFLLQRSRGERLHYCLNSADYGRPGPAATRSAHPLWRCVPSGGSTTALDTPAAAARPCRKHPLFEPADYGGSWRPVSRPVSELSTRGLHLQGPAFGGPTRQTTVGGNAPRVQARLELCQQLSGELLCGDNRTFSGPPA